MLFLGNVDKLIYFRFYRRVNLQEIITAQNELPIPIPSNSCGFSYLHKRIPW